MAVTRNAPKSSKRAAKRPALPPKSPPRISTKRRAVERSNIAPIDPPNGLGMLAVAALQGAREEAQATGFASAAGQNAETVDLTEDRANSALQTALNLSTQRSLTPPPFSPISLPSPNPFQPSPPQQPPRRPNRYDAIADEIMQPGFGRIAPNQRQQQRRARSTQSTRPEGHTSTTRGANVLNIESHGSVTPSTRTLVEASPAAAEDIDIHIACKLYLEGKKEPEIMENKRGTGILEQFDPESWTSRMISELRKREIQYTPIQLFASLSTSKLRVQKIEQTLHDSTSWDEIKQMAIKWHADGYSDLRIDIGWRIKPISPSTESNSMSNAGQTPLEKRKATITEKKQQEEALNSRIEKATLEEAGAIIDKHRCHVGSCTNNPMPCYIYKDIHVKIHHEQVKQWAKAIVGLEATLSEPPDALRNSLQRAAEEKIAKKQLKSKKPTATQSPTKSMPPQQPLIINNYLNDPLSRPKKLKSKSAHTAQNDVPSSPVRVDGDPDEALYQYIAYHKQQRPNQEAIWNNALDILQQNMIEVDQLRSVSLEKLESWGIPFGVAMKLRDHVKSWSTKKRVSTGDRANEEEPSCSSSSIASEE